MDIKERMKSLIDKLNEAARAYYSDEKEIMTNLEYDTLYDELVSMEKESGIILSGSPTQRVGYEVISELPKALDIYILPGHRLPAKGLIAVDKVLGRSMRSLPGKNGFRFALQDSQKKKITNFVLRLLLLASGEEDKALGSKDAKEKAGKK